MPDPEPCEEPCGGLKRMVLAVVGWGSAHKNSTRLVAAARMDLGLADLDERSNAVARIVAGQ